MQNIIVGTAGHVDHGKTCLIKALSGFDTDRLKEEKKRGITIDLGFASLPNEQGLHIGIIDVPGHEKFVKNMLAGIGGIDLVLMVIALDEGVMPQTVEHFEILKMLGIRRGIIVLTKADLVDEDWAALVEADVEELVKGSFLEHAPMIRVSAYTGQNIDKLHAMILEKVADLGKRREEPELFRLPIDRVFTMEGFGTVITGTLQEGSVRVGDEIMVYPQERLIRVRGIQSHGKREEEACAGQRTALNLQNVRKEDLVRGDVLAYPGSLIRTSFVDVRVSIFKTSKRELRNGDRVHLSYGAAQVIAKAVLLNKDAIGAGESDYAQLRFDEPVVMKRGDRFIIRFLSPTETFGGGVVLDAAAAKHKRNDEEVLAVLAVKENGTDEAIAELEIREESRSFPKKSRISAILDLPAAEVFEITEHLKAKKKILIFADDSMIHMDYWKQIAEYADALLKKFHAENPITEGMDKEEFKSRLSDAFYLKDMRTAGLLLDELVKRGIAKTSGTYVSSKEFAAEYSDELGSMLEHIKNAYEKAGFEAPLTAEVLEPFKDKNRAKQIVADLQKNERLVKISPTVYMDADAYEKAVALLRAKIDQSGAVSLAEVRDLFGTSRKYAVQFLECLDKKKITKMVGEKRVLIH